MRVIISILSILLLSGCDYVNNLTTSSELIKKTIDTESIESIIIEAPCNIVLHHENKDLSIIGQEHLLNDLMINSENQQLIIDHAKKDYLQKSKLIEVHVNADKLSNITINRVMSLSSNEIITSSNLSIVVNGTAKFTEIDLELKNNSTLLNVYGFNNSGNYRLIGSCETFNTNIEGSVNVYASELQSNKVLVKHKSIGECQVYSKEILGVETYSSGNTYYKGDPSSVSHEHIQNSLVTPSGQLIKL